MMNSSTKLALLVLTSAPLAAQSFQQPFPTVPAGNGYWEAPFNHDTEGFANSTGSFNVIHMALIPKGPHRGKVLVFDEDDHAPAAVWTQRWALVDVSRPERGPQFQNHDLTMPANEGNLFCVGFTWMPDGNLFLAGGTTQYSSAGGDPFWGADLTYIYDPADFSGTPEGTWYRQPDMERMRWYPTVKLLPNDEIMVAGGVESQGHPANDYEIFTPAGRGVPAGNWKDINGQRVFSGPQSFQTKLTIYPRLHLLSDGDVFMSGMLPGASKVDPLEAPESWTPMDISKNVRIYGSSVFFHFPTNPSFQKDLVINIGGETSGPGGKAVINSVQAVFPLAQTAPAWDYIPSPPMILPRKHHNALILPDASVLVVGGRANDNGEFPAEWVMNAELYKDGEWTLLPEAASQRGYHSTLLLLPDGRVLNAGANSRTWDYQVFIPHYLQSGFERPVIEDVAESWSYYCDDPTPITIDYAFAVEAEAEGKGKLVDRTTRTTTAIETAHSTGVSKAVLLKPGAVTHHTDYEQRYVELIVEDATATTLTVRPPLDSAVATRGYYMLFILSDDGIPSEAAWIHVQ